jgi:hypothetical protein
MATYVYKAYDSEGRKKTGTLNVFSPQEVYLALRERGLKVYFVEDLAKIKRVVHRRQRVRKTVIWSGAAAIAVALAVSAGMVGYAGRAKPLTMSDYEQSGLITSGSGNFVADSKEGEQLARDIFEAWNSFAPQVMIGIEVRKGMMAIHVTRAVRDLAADDLDHLATNSVRALHRRLGFPGATLLILEDDVTIMEVRYNGATNSTHVTNYL